MEKQIPTLDEPEGGDPPCWAHLADEETGEIRCSTTGAEISDHPAVSEIPNPLIAGTSGGAGVAIRVDGKKRLEATDER